MMQDEGEEVINVERKTYKEYLDMAGGIFVLIFVFIVMSFFAFTKIYSDYLIGVWTKSPD